MWKFWSVLGALLIGGGVYAVLATWPVYRVESTYTASVPTSLPPAPRAEPSPVRETPAVVVHHEEPVTAHVAVPVQVEPAPAAAPEAAPAFVDSDSFEALVPVPEAVAPPVVVPAVEVKPAAAKPAAVPTPAVAAPAAGGTKFAGFDVIPAKIEKKDDGSQLLDGKYILKGEGTAEKPYIVSWDLLSSVEETFDPQNEKKRLPERVTMLDGKIVRLGGYVAFPMTSKEPRELLSMLNQWDGCCIGTPPTPYDAVEVGLKGVVSGDDRYATTGRVSGVFHVKPYLQGDWLIGLYTMDDAALSVKEFGGTRAN